MVNDYIFFKKSVCVCVCLFVCVILCLCLCVVVCTIVHLVLCNDFGTDLEIATHHPVHSLRFSQLKTLKIDAKGRQSFHLFFGFRLSWYHCVTLTEFHVWYVYIYIFTCTIRLTISCIGKYTARPMDPMYHSFASQNLCFQLVKLDVSSQELPLAALVGVLLIMQAPVLGGLSQVS